MLTLLAAASIYISTAKDAARWIDSQLPVATVDLYYGLPGLVLFNLNLGDVGKAKRAGEQLVAQIDRTTDPGLYTGLAGTGYALAELWKATGDPKYREAAARCAARVRDLPNDDFDIISGTAGTGLFLLYASRELHDAQALDAARCAADRLVAIRAAEQVGVSWSDDYPRIMPNFSHGTAGVAYFLATMYIETKDRRYLDAAIAGARHLLSIATTTNNHCEIYHHTPGGESLYYLGWCHGPVGTARLFYRLYQATGDQQWMTWTKRAAQSIIDSGIPEQRTPGFWNNVSVCCGDAGVARFFLDLYRLRKNVKYLRFAERVAANLVASAQRDAAGARWPQAENRVSPNEVAAQTGWMQGAAGIGSVLLDLDAVTHGRKPRFSLPDSPF